MHSAPLTHPHTHAGHGVAPPQQRRAGPRASGPEPEYKLFEWFQGVRFSVSYVAFLVYIISLVTSRLPLGTEAMAVAILALPFEKKKFVVPTGGKILFGFILWILLGYMATPWQPVVWDSTVQLFKAAAIYLVAVNVLSDWKRFRLFALIFLGAYLYYPGRGAITFWATGAYTVFGRAVWLYIYENPNDLAGLSFLPLAFGLWMLSERGHRLARLGALGAAGICAFVIVLTQSRGAMLALIGMSVLSLAGHHKKARAALMGLLMVGVVAIFAPDDVMDRFTGMITSDSIEEIDPEDSASSRWQIWKISLEISSDRPVTGWGFGAYHLRHFEHVRGRQDIMVQARGPRDTHSTYFKLLAETGFVGLGLFLAMLFSTLGAIGRAQRMMTRYDAERATQLKYLRNAMIAFMMAGVFASYAELAFLYVHLAAMTAVSALAIQTIKREQRRRSISQSPPPVGSAHATPPLRPRYAHPG